MKQACLLICFILAAGLRWIQQICRLSSTGSTTPGTIHLIIGPAPSCCEDAALPWSHAEPDGGSFELRFGQCKSLLCYSVAWKNSHLFEFKRQVAWEKKHVSRRTGKVAVLFQQAKKIQQAKEQVSHEKNTSYFPLYWLLNRDPYNGVL